MGLVLILFLLLYLHSNYSSSKGDENNKQWVNKLDYLHSNIVPIKAIQENGR